VLVGHSYGTDLAAHFLLAHPSRVAGLVLLAGPFLGPWREPYRAAERARRSESQRARLAELDALAARTEDEETEYLALSWFTDHADRDRAWEWALASARVQRPVNYAMNSQLNADKKVDPLESHVDDLRAARPERTVIIGGEGDTRPADALRRLGSQLGCPVVLIPDAGHDPWLEKPDEFRAAFRAAVG
jgi:proline iminopeptidase